MGIRVPERGEIVEFVLPNDVYLDAEVLYPIPMMGGYGVPGANLRVDLPPDMAARWAAMDIALVVSMPPFHPNYHREPMTRQHLVHEGRIWCAAVPFDAMRHNGTWYYKGEG